MTVRVESGDSLDGARWVTRDMPCFAVVGKVNMGKSAVLATLLEEDDDRIIRISPEPGATTRCQRLSLVLDGAERLRFIDTPGFQEPIEALRAIRALHDEPQTTPGLDTLHRFVSQYGKTDEFADERRLLAPLIEGAGIVYVIDPGVPVNDSFLAEIEILRFSGRARLAVLNARGDDAERGANHEAAWREHLGKAFNLVRGFDAHRARFAGRRDLLAALTQIDERDRDHLDATMALLDAEWQQRREQAADQILIFLEAALTHREYAQFDGESPAAESARREAVAKASARYFSEITRLERDAANRLLGLYRHTAVRAEASKSIGDDLDLASDETWSRLGLTRRQLTFVGAVMGAGAGVGIDVATVGHSLGLVALLGGIGGGALAFFKGDAIPTLRLDIGRVGALGGQRVTLGPPRNPNFPWVLLDSILIRYRQILARAHARRGDVFASGVDPSVSVVRTLSGEHQKALARWFRAVTKNRASGEASQDAWKALIDTLAAIEGNL